MSPLQPNLNELEKRIREIVTNSTTTAGVQYEFMRIVSALAADLKHAHQLKEDAQVEALASVSESGKLQDDLKREQVNSANLRERIKVLEKVQEDAAAADELAAGRIRAANYDKTILQQKLDQIQGRDQIALKKALAESAELKKQVEALGLEVTALEQEVEAVEDEPGDEADPVDDRIQELESSIQVAVRLLGKGAEDLAEREGIGIPETDAALTVLESVL